MTPSSQQGSEEPMVTALLPVCRSLSAGRLSDVLLRAAFGPDRARNENLTFDPAGWSALPPSPCLASNPPSPARPSATCHPHVLLCSSALQRWWWCWRLRGGLHSGLPPRGLDSGIMWSAEDTLRYQAEAAAPVGCCEDKSCQLILVTSDPAGSFMSLSPAGSLGSEAPPSPRYGFAGATVTFEAPELPEETLMEVRGGVSGTWQAGRKKVDWSWEVT